PILPDDVVKGMETRVEIAGTTTKSFFKGDLIAEAHVVVSLLKDNNSAPTTEDANILGAAIDGLGERYASKRHDRFLRQLQLNTLLCEISGLLDDSAAIQAQQDYFKSYRSPLRCLSPDILIHIFSYHVDEWIVAPSMPTLLTISQIYILHFRHPAVWILCTPFFPVLRISKSKEN
ncbi:hypothetical protein DXG03_008337, partial [Asterophora parasitica]